MKVEGVTPAATASSPDHPDHDRWVKEKTFKMEVEHAQAVGLSLRHAESENARLLERMEAVARLAPAVPGTVQRPKKRKTRAERIMQRAVQITAAQPQIVAQKLSPCGRCGTCRRCMRERRVLAIIQRAKTGDALMERWAAEIAATAIFASGGVGPFRGMTQSDVTRAVIRKAEDICDKSVAFLGKWEP